MMFGGSWAPSLKGSDGGPLSDFIEGLGPGQLVGRQVLGSPSLGDIQLSMCYQKGYLEVEVIRARGLQARPGSKVLPGNVFKNNCSKFAQKCNFPTHYYLCFVFIFLRTKARYFSN